MRRRDLILGLGGFLGIAAAAQAQQRCCRTVGLLAPTRVFATLDLEHDFALFGWVSGRDYQLLFRTSDSSNGALPSLAAELAVQKADVILAAGDQAVIAAQRVTATIPIVGIVDDMVGSGLVASMARPGGNTTGISILASELDVKRLQLLHEIAPLGSRFGVLADPTTIATGPKLDSAAAALNIELVTRRGSDAASVARAVEELVEAKVAAVNVLASPILDDQRATIVERLNGARLPAIFQWPEAAETGGLVGYGPRLTASIHDMVHIADRVLRGALPADIPVQQPTKFELVINLKTAKALGLTVPQSMLQRADEVIE